MSLLRFLADEDFRFAIVAAVRNSESHVEISTVQESGLSGFNDPDVLEYAENRGLLLLSHDVNTLKAEAERRMKSGRSIPGLFLAAQRSGTREIAESILTIWGASEAEEWRDRIVFLPI